jgi:hypothetical protein
VPVYTGVYALGTAFVPCFTLETQLWHDGVMPDKPTSEQIRREAEKLRETAIDLMDHAVLLIGKSVELEKRILDRDRPKPKPKKKS